LKLRVFRNILYKRKECKDKKERKIDSQNRCFIKVNRKLCMTSNKGQRETGKVVVDPESATFLL
jgi:hypothetical protein